MIATGAGAVAELRSQLAQQNAALEASNQEAIQLKIQLSKAVAESSRVVVGPQGKATTFQHLTQQVVGRSTSPKERMIESPKRRAVRANQEVALCS